MHNAQCTMDAARDRRLMSKLLIWIKADFFKQSIKSLAMRG